jgi:hypothetical protein
MSASLLPEPKGEKPDPHSVAQNIDWDDFRDHISTADEQGHRRWIYARKPSGKWYRWRTWASWVLIGIMFAGPFIRIHGNPLLLFNIVERRFSILGRIFWPQDTIIFAVALLVFITGIIILRRLDASGAGGRARKR